MEKHKATASELDELVGREIFGIRKFYYNNDDFTLGIDGDKEHPYYIPSGKPLKTHRIDAVPLPRYSTSHAWLVVDKMVADGHVFNIEVTKEGAQAWFGGCKGYIVKKSSPALAICLAALITVGALDIPEE